MHNILINNIVIILSMKKKLTRACSTAGSFWILYIWVFGLRPGIKRSNILLFLIFYSCLCWIRSRIWVQLVQRGHVQAQVFKVNLGPGLGLGPPWIRTEPSQYTFLVVIALGFWKCKGSCGVVTLICRSGWVSLF